MIVKDKVYGVFQISEPVVKCLILSKPLQRLKYITQSGYAFFLDKEHPYSKFNVTRYEHSLGVFLLLRKLGASLEEQIAGLLHDVSHLALSHVADFVYGRYVEHDYHEKIKEEYVLKTEIPKILEEHGFSVEEILDESRYTLLERELPDVCADRVDYSLRDLVCCLNFPRNEALTMVNSLVPLQGELVFANYASANKFAEWYFYANREIYCNPLQASLFKLIADTVKKALEKGILNESDLFGTDLTVYTKLKKSGDSEIEKMLKLISKLRVVEDEENYDFHVRSKVRWVNPKFIDENGKIRRVMDVDKGYKERVEKWVEKAKRGFYVRILNK